MKGLYYFTNKVYHFYQSLPIFQKLGGKIITNWEFPITYFYFVFKYGPAKTRITNRRLSRIDGFVNGLLLCSNADDRVPPGKNYKRVFVYHGTSDKVFTLKDKKLDISWFEYYFLSGPKELYKLKTFSHNSELLDKRIVKIGMFRSDTIIRKEYDKEKILKKYGIEPDGKKIILYAPTWKWGGGTLRECFEEFAKKITKEYVLIIRPHYNDRKNIKYIIKWQKENKIKDLYIFPKQYQDIMDFICISDLMIGDNSAVNYEFAMTRRPMILVNSITEDIFIPPDEFNLRACVPIYKPGEDDILRVIQDAFNTSIYVKKISELVDRSFYFNDGHAIDRACSFIIDKLSEMGIVDREKALREYGNHFEYMDNYRI